MDKNQAVNQYLDGPLQSDDLSSALDKASDLQYVTLGDLVAQDIPNGAMLFEFPSTFNKAARFLNNEKYLTYDLPTPSVFFIEQLQVLRGCAIAGDKIPFLLSAEPQRIVQDHWQEWVPGYKPFVFKPYSDLDKPDFDVVMVSFPHQRIPAAKHAVDPDLHHRLLSKAFVPYMGATHPRYMTSTTWTLPCMIKAAHGQGTWGTFKATTEEEFKDYFSQLTNHIEKFDPPIITQVIENIERNNCLQFYLFKTGKVHWLGVTHQIIREPFEFNGGVVHFDEQLVLKDLLWDTVRPVAEFLHKEGYFGLVGIDILTNKQGKYVIDVNLRINGSTTQVMLAPRMANLGYGVSMFRNDGKFAGSLVDLMELANCINREGEARVVVISYAEIDSSRCDANVVIFSKTEKACSDVYSRLFAKRGSTSRS